MTSRGFGLGLVFAFVNGVYTHRTASMIMETFCACFVFWGFCRFFFVSVDQTDFTTPTQRTPQFAWLGLKVGLGALAIFFTFLASADEHTAGEDRREGGMGGRKRGLRWERGKSTGKWNRKERGERR